MQNRLKIGRFEGRICFLLFFSPYLTPAYPIWLAYHNLIQCTQAACTMRGVFYCSEKGQVIAYSRDGAGRLPGKPERNAVPTKGDTMGMARAGSKFPAFVIKHNIFSVHIAVPSKGIAAFFYSTYLYFFPSKPQKNASGFIRMRWEL